MGTAPVAEVQHRYDVGAAVVLPPLQGVPGVQRMDPPVDYMLGAEYFDTEDLRLASGHITLQRRTGAEDAGWHLELSAPVDDRPEYREPLGNDPDAVPEALLTLIRVHTRDKKLIRVATLTALRTVHRLRGKDNSVLAEIRDDRVTAETLLPPQRTERWREWDIELMDGSKDLLEAAGKRLAAAGAAPSAHASHLARVLGTPPTPDAPPHATRKATAADVLAAYLHEQVRTLKDQDPQVRLDVEDSVHKMRVATRRMRSVLATYRKLFADRESVQSVRDELKWLAGVLGEARDTEVMHARLKEMIGQEPADLVLGPVARRVDLELGAEYHRAHANVIEALDGERYFRLLDALDSLLAAPHLTPLAGKRAHKAIPKLVGKDVKRLRRAVKEARNNPAGITDHPALHEARKDGKRLRYAAEAAAPVNPTKASHLADAAHSVQKVLGEHQDSIVTRRLLRRLGAESFLQGENGFSYGRLHALEQSAAMEAEARFHRDWKKFPSPKL